MPATALQHFQEDIARAKQIVAHADPLPQVIVQCRRVSPKPA
ncbi:MAG TPA: hypothetical protein VKU82_03580 [Planctomycetaceae bacterium]|nr:hypothetical protein [Planctomycetaceae bacterium]